MRTRHSTRQRALGQNFLHHQPSIEKISSLIESEIENLSVTPELRPRCIIEIGPGRLALSLPLKKISDSLSIPLILVERDRHLEEDIIEGLRDVETHFMDAASDKFKALIDELQLRKLTPVYVASNLPYSASTQILAGLCHKAELVSGMSVMVQKEVALRMVADNVAKSRADRGSFSLLIQSYFIPEIMFDIGPGAFTPPPKVMSSVLRLRRSIHPKIKKLENPFKFEKFCKMIFTQRRKMIRHFIPKDVDASSIGITGTERAETLSLDTMIELFKLLAGIILFISCTQPAHANTGEIYGYGSKAQAMGNTMLSGSREAFATYYNPAANSENDGISFAFGMQYAHPSFLEIKSVVTDNQATTSVGGSVKSDVDTGYLDHFSQSVAMSFNFGERLKYLSIGLLASSPVMRLAYFDTGDPFKPEYFNYRSRTQKPEFYFSVGFKPVESWSFAAGLKYASNITNTANYTVSGSNATVSHGRITSTVKPSVSGFASAHHKSERSEQALTIRMPTKYLMNTEVKSNARVLGSSGDFPIIFNSDSTLFYDPFEVDLGASYELSENYWATLELDWYNYSAYEPAVVSVTDSGSAIQLKNSVSSKPTMRDIFVPRIGLERRFYSTTARFGYYWRASPVKDNSGTGNLVDPEKHVFSAGLGFDLKKAHITERQIVLDLHAQYHWLVKSGVKKNLGNEAGGSGNLVGSPEYDIGGSIYGGGLSFSMLF